MSNQKLTWEEFEKESDKGKQKFNKFGHLFTSKLNYFFNKLDRNFFHGKPKHISNSCWEMVIREKIKGLFKSNKTICNISYDVSNKGIKIIFKIKDKSFVEVINKIIKDDSKVYKNYLGDFLDIKID
jgi:hypothetical protein